VKPQSVATVSAPMDSFARSPASCVTPKLDALERIPLAEFIACWRLLTGEPPAVMLDDRSQMLALLVESVPAAQLTLPEPIHPYDCTQRARLDALSSSGPPSNVLRFRPRCERSPAP
jgi:hypothetical protein